MDWAGKLSTHGLDIPLTSPVWFLTGAPEKLFRPSRWLSNLAIYVEDELGLTLREEVDCIKLHPCNRTCRLMEWDGAQQDH